MKLTFYRKKKIFLVNLKKINTPKKKKYFTHLIILLRDIKKNY